MDSNATLSSIPVPLMMILADTGCKFMVIPALFLLQALESRPTRGGEPARGFSVVGVWTVGSCKQWH